MGAVVDNNALLVCPPRPHLLILVARSPPEESTLAKGTEEPVEEPAAELAGEPAVDVARVEPAASEEEVAEPAGAAVVPEADFVDEEQTVVSVEEDVAPAVVGESVFDVCMKSDRLDWF